MTYLTRLLPMAIVASLLLHPGVSRAATYTYSPSGTGIWSTSTDWTPNGVPTIGDDVIFGTPTTANQKIWGLGSFGTLAVNSTSSSNVVSLYVTGGAGTNYSNTNATSVSVTNGSLSNPYYNGSNTYDFGSAAMSFGNNGAFNANAGTFYAGSWTFGGTSITNAVYTGITGAGQATTIAGDVSVQAGGKLWQYYAGKTVFNNNVTMNASNAAVNAGNSAIGGGSIVVQGTYNQSAGTALIYKNSTLSLSSANITGGTVALAANGNGTSTAAAVFAVGANSTITSSSAVVVIEADTSEMQVNGTSTVLTIGSQMTGTTGQLSKTGTGTILVTTGTSDYTGGTRVSAGRYLVSNTSGRGTGKGVVMVDSGAVLGGNGYITPDAGNSITISGTLAPGLDGANGTLNLALTGSSKLSFAANSHIALDLGAASDAIAFTGTAGDFLSGSGTATLDLTLGSGFSYANTYTVFQNTTTTGFSLAGITGYDTADYTAVFALGSGANANNYVLSFVSIPEPSEASLIGAALLVGTVVLYRRKNMDGTVL